MKKTLIIIALIFALPMICYYVLSGKQAQVSEVAVASQANGMPKLIKFSSPMCSDCQRMAEIISEVVDDYKDKVEFVEISVNQNSPQVREQIKRHNVKLVPTMVFINSKGEIVGRVEGSIPKEDLIMYLEKGLK